MNLPTLDNPAQSQVCSLLRTKTAFGSYMLETDADGDVPWQERDSTTAVFWCLCTMETAGPDDVFAHPTACRAGRACYRADA
jgi:hypothetical protein